MEMPFKMDAGHAAVRCWRSVEVIFSNWLLTKVLFKMLCKMRVFLHRMGNDMYSRHDGRTKSKIRIREFLESESRIREPDSRKVKSTPAGGWGRGS